MKALTLESLQVSMNTYGQNEGKYTGTIHFKGQYGAIELVLAPSISEHVLALCADALVENAKDVANNLTAAIINQVDRQLAPPVAIPPAMPATPDDLPF